MTAAGDDYVIASIRAEMHQRLDDELAELRVTASHWRRMYDDKRAGLRDVIPKPLSKYQRKMR